MSELKKRSSGVSAGSGNRHVSQRKKSTSAQRTTDSASALGKKNSNLQIRQPDSLVLAQKLSKTSGYKGAKSSKNPRIATVVIDNGSTGSDKIDV